MAARGSPAAPTRAPSHESGPPRVLRLASPPPTPSGQTSFPWKPVERTVLGQDSREGSRQWTPRPRRPGPAERAHLVAVELPSEPGRSCPSQPGESSQAQRRRTGRARRWEPPHLCAPCTASIWSRPSEPGASSWWRMVLRTGLSGGGGRGPRSLPELGPSSRGTEKPPCFPILTSPRRKKPREQSGPHRTLLHRPTDGSIGWMDGSQAVGLSNSRFHFKGNQTNVKANSQKTRRRRADSSTPTVKPSRQALLSDLNPAPP